MLSVARGLPRSYEVVVYGRLKFRVGQIVWDGLDAYGRRLQGPQKVRGHIDYFYPALYGAPAPGGTGRSFGGGGAYALDPEFAFNRANLEIAVSRQFEAEIGPPLDARPLGLGGWTLDVHHVLDPLSGRLLLGNGDVREPPSFVIHRVAGRAEGSGGSSGDGGPATEAYLSFPSGTAVASDGTLYILDSARVRSVSTDGIIHTVAGNGSLPNDGGPAIEAGFNQLFIGIAIGPDASIYVSDIGCDGSATAARSRRSPVLGIPASRVTAVRHPPRSFMNRAASRSDAMGPSTSRICRTTASVASRPTA